MAVRSRHTPSSVAISGWNHPASRSAPKTSTRSDSNNGRRRAEGLARLRAALTIHGRCGAEIRAHDRQVLTTLASRARVMRDAIRHRDRLPPEFAARLSRVPPELMPPPWRSSLSRPEDRALVRAEEEALAPLKLAIATAKAAMRHAAPAMSGAAVAVPGLPSGARPDRAIAPEVPEPRPPAAAASCDAEAGHHAPEGSARDYAIPGCPEARNPRHTKTSPGRHKPLHLRDARGLVRP
jgi:hypothetical protein